MSRVFPTMTLGKERQCALGASSLLIHWLIIAQIALEPQASSRITYRLSTFAGKQASGVKPGGKCGHVMCLFPADYLD
jgi:hypothetical protein